MRSVVVVLPASMWATIPMFRRFDRSFVIISNYYIKKTSPRQFSETIACKSWLLDEPPPEQPPDAYSELARDVFIDFLKSGNPLPDAFYFSDDYLCAGALAALSDAGIRAPQDVRIATWANHGNVPIYARPLSRIELNPWKDAEDTHAFCRDILSGKNPGKPDGGRSAFCGTAIATRCTTVDYARWIGPDDPEIMLTEFADEDDTLTYFRTPIPDSPILVDDELFGK